MKHSINFLSFIFFIVSSSVLGAEKTDSSKVHFENSLNELQLMLTGKAPVDFEKAVFLSENPYWDNRYTYADFQKGIDRHLYWVKELKNVNDQSDSLDFSVKVQANGKFNLDDIRYTETEKKELYNDVLSNWAIFTYITDTTAIFPFLHYPFPYATNDPFGMDHWENSQVSNLIFSKKAQGNCFALTGLYKILANRMQSDVKICTAPQHIYIQHKDHKGDFYNVELATAGHPADGTIQTLTYTTNEAIMNGIALREYSEKESVGLCLVNLAKSYERKFNIKTDDFILQCAELALVHDSLNLNALLLKQQVLDERVKEYALKNNINTLKGLQNDTKIASTLTDLENHLANLQSLGYRQMPLAMQETVLNAFSEKEHMEIYREKNASPFTTITPKDKEDAEYVTLSHGNFQEVFEHQKTLNYGHFTFDTETKKLLSIDTGNRQNFIIDPVAFAYDFGARVYDSRLGRFLSIDPMTKEFPHNTPYGFAGNKPITHVDRNGEDEYWYVLTYNDAGSPILKLNNYEDSFLDRNPINGEIVNRTIHIEYNGESYTFTNDNPLRPGLDKVLPFVKKADNYNYQTDAEFEDEKEKVLAVYSGILGLTRYATKKLLETKTTTPEIPGKAKDVVDYAKKNKGGAQAGYKGGKKYDNDGRDNGQILPQQDKNGNSIEYKEYDVNKYQKGVNRGKERVVMGSDGNSYYTKDHYKTFTQIK